MGCQETTASHSGELLDRPQGTGQIGEVDTSEIVFPKLETSENETSEFAILKGKMYLRDKCIVSVFETLEYLIIWPENKNLESDSLGIFINGDNGSKIRIGDTIWLGGGERNTYKSHQVNQDIIDHCKADKIWITSGSVNNRGPEQQPAPPAPPSPS